MSSSALYRLVVSQLADDGHVGAAAAVAAATCTPQHASAELPRHALLQLVNGRALDPLAPGVASLRTTKRVAASYRTCCAEDVGSQHVVTRFSTDGRQLAVGTSDGTVHVLDAQVRCRCLRARAFARARLVAPPRHGAASPESPPTPTPHAGAAQGQGLCRERLSSLL